MLEALQPIEFWHWWVFAIALVVIEIFASGFFFLWLGVAAAVVGFILLLLPETTLQAQLLIFAVISVVSVVAWQVFRRRHPALSDHPQLNRRGEAYVGRVLTLDAPIENGVGWVRVDDSRWKVVGEDMAQGTRVRVTDADGPVLKVERA
jgi:membrane protein implicated in regulation of membrane protease activity